MNNSKTPVLSDIIKDIIKNNHIFNNINIVSRSRIIKVLPKSDMAIIWLDVWDSQNGMNAKRLINCCFNIGKYIATICEANMNPGILQCKKCWKWGHLTYVCRVQKLKCVKCNRPHLTEHHKEFLWCYKANTKSNLPRLETKVGELCSYSLKCINCKEDHQVDSNLCSFNNHHIHPD